MVSKVFLAVELPMGIIVILHNVSSSVYEFLDYKLVHTTTLIINLLICLSYPLNFGIYCGMSRQFRETFKELFMKVCTYFVFSLIKPHFPSWIIITPSAPN